MTTCRIPFNKAGMTGRECELMVSAVNAGHISGDGPCTRLCSETLQQWLGVPQVLLTTSCTHALEMAAILLDIQAGDEVIVPAFTFVSTINAFVLRGARPVFADIRPDTLNLDERMLAGYITEKTKAVVPVHYAGVGCEMREILALAAARNVAVVEDNAHGLGGRYGGRWLGSFGQMATLSFHETKNFTCGEGGALLINDPRYCERAEIIREKGTNRSRFFRGQVDKYSWVDIGSSYLPSDLLAAFLLAQLEHRDEIQGRRRLIWNTYHDGVHNWAVNNGVGLPVIPADREQAYHMFYMVMPSMESRQALIAHLKAKSILAVFHYLPLHLSDMGRRFGGKPGDCPVTERISDRLIRLPFYTNLSKDDQAVVIEAVRAFRP